MALLFNFIWVAWTCLFAMIDVANRMKKLRMRRWWVRPHFKAENRDQFGAFTRLFEYFELKDHEEFYHFIGMSVAQFKFILNAVRDDLTSTSNRPGLSPDLKLAAVLNFLRFGPKVASQSWFFLIGRSTMYKLIATVPGIIYKRLGPVYMKFPEGEEWLKTVADFYKLHGYPHCLGALDGRHFEIKRPPNSGSMYINRKHYNSIVLLAMCDAHRRFTYASVGWRGFQNDSGIYALSSLCRNLQNGRIVLPPPRALPGSTIIFPYTIVADGGFATTQYTMTPYRASRYTSIEERIFYLRLTEPRKVIECAFGTLCAKFQIFSSRLNFGLKTSNSIILCCMTLHNFLITVELESRNEDGSSSSSSSDSDSSENESSSSSGGRSSSSNSSTNSSTSGSTISSNSSASSAISSNSNSNSSVSDESMDSESSINENHSVADHLLGEPVGVIEDCVYEGAENSSDEDTEQEEEQEQRDGRALRDVLRDYFVTDGAQSWQWRKLYRN